MASSIEKANKGKKTKKFSLFDALLSGNGEESFADASLSKHDKVSSSQQADKVGVKKAKKEGGKSSKDANLPAEKDTKKIVVHRSFADIFKSTGTSASSFTLKVRSNQKKDSSEHDNANAMMANETAEQSVAEKEALRAQEKRDVEQKAYDRLKSIIEGDRNTKQPPSSADGNNKTKQRAKEDGHINLHRSKKKGTVLKRKILRERLEHYLEDSSSQRSGKSPSKKKGDANTNTSIKCTDGQVARVAVCISNYLSMDILGSEDELLEATMHMRQWIRMMANPSESNDNQQTTGLFGTVVFVVVIETPIGTESLSEKEVRIDVWITCDLVTAIRASQSLNGLQWGGEFLSISIMTTARPVRDPTVKNGRVSDVFEIDAGKDNFFDVHMSGDNDDGGNEKESQEESVNVVNCGVRDYVSFWRANQDRVVVQEDGKIVFQLGSVVDDDNATPVLLLDNLFTDEDMESYIDDAEEAIEVLRDIYSLLQGFGSISRMWINTPTTNETGDVSKSMVCILFDDPSCVNAAARELDDSIVGGTPVHATKWDSSFEIEESIAEWRPDEEKATLVDKPPLTEEDLSLIGSAVPMEAVSIFAAAKMAPKLPVHQGKTTDESESGTSKIFSFDELTQIAAAVPQADAAVEEMLKNLLKQLSKFQSAAHEKDPTKAKMRQRYVSGLKQSINGCKSGSAKLVVLSRDTESSKELDKKLHSLIIEANKNEIPVIFGLSRRQLGKVIGSNNKVATIAVYDPNGCYDIFKAIIMYHESQTS